MSVMRENEMKIVLPRHGSHEFWSLIHQHYAGSDPVRWKYLAMLVLRECGGWSLSQIGLVFDHDRAHITRCLNVLKRELRLHFDAPQVLELPDESEEDGETEG